MRVKQVSNFYCWNTLGALSRWTKIKIALLLLLFLDPGEETNIKILLSYLDFGAIFSKIIIVLPDSRENNWLSCDSFIYKLQHNNNIFLKMYDSNTFTFLWIYMTHKITLIHFILQINNKEKLLNTSKI